ncbi:hypothetical protein [Henriciella sp.]|uniref:hypothetical protein n=1 Tax=Henriciella sp. TaxID=1968823 RepID=UPI0025C1364A|nr:hypothetical protein [Henriciella sp.]
MLGGLTGSRKVVCANAQRSAFQRMGRVGPLRRVRPRIKHTGPDLSLLLEDADHLISEVRITSGHGQKMVYVDRRVGHVWSSSPDTVLGEQSSHAIPYPPVKQESPTGIDSCDCK